MHEASYSLKPVSDIILILPTYNQKTRKCGDDFVIGT
jgi:hypothetical protein